MTEPISRWPNRAASLILLISAGIVVWGSFTALVVRTVRFTGGVVVDYLLTLWVYSEVENGQVIETRSETILFGITAMVAVILLVAAAVTVWRATPGNRRQPWARALTGLAAGWTSGTTAFAGMIALNVLDDAGDHPGDPTAGLGMWLLLAATALTIAMAIALTMRDLATPRPAPGVHLWANRAPGVLPLAIAAAGVIVASFLALYTETRVFLSDTMTVSTTLWGRQVNDNASSGLVEWGLPVTVAAGLLFVGAGLLMLNDRNPERRRAGMFGRLTASVGAGMLGGLVTAFIVVMFDDMFIGEDDPTHRLKFVVGNGTYLLAATVALATFGALRGGKPINTPDPEPITPQTRPS